MTLVFYVTRVGNVVSVHMAQQGRSLPPGTLTVDDVIPFAKQAVARIVSALDLRKRAYGVRPVARRTARSAAQNTSAFSLGGAPFACSGARRTAASVGALVGSTSARIFARPKSPSFTAPSHPTTTLSGATPPWTIGAGFPADISSSSGVPSEVYFFASAASFSRYFFAISSCSCFGTMA